MSVALTDNLTHLAFKAGRCFRRAGTNFVDANPTKGAIVLSNGEDGLLHFTWKDRATGALGEDLILFPGDATFEKVAQAPGGRTYVLRFESSDQKHFVSRPDPTRCIPDEDLVLDAGDAAFSDAPVMATSDLTSFLGCIVSSGRRIRGQPQ